MATNTVTCPACRALLRVSEAAASGLSRVECPGCHTQFSALEPTSAAPDSESGSDLMPSSTDDFAPALRRSLVPGLLIAVLGAMVLVGGAVAGLYFLAPASPPAAPPAVSAAVATTVHDAKAADNEAADRAAKEKQQGEFIRLMVRAGLAKQQQRYADAVKDYKAALALMPGNAEATAGLHDAEKGLQAAAVARTADDKRQADFKSFMQQGKDALAGEQYAQAVRAYEAALQLVPGDAAAVRALADAKGRLAKDEQEKKKLAEYEDHMTAGRAAMVAQRYPDAVREFLAAQRRIPGDAAAARGLHDAEQRLAQLKDDSQRKDAYVRLMRQAGTAANNQRYREAVRAYKAALKLVPDDPAAQRGLRDAQKGLKQAKEQYAQLMNTGTTALQLNNVPAAIQAFQQAAQVMPNDVAALAALRQAQQLVANVAAVQTVAANAQLGYEQLMVTGTAALFGQRYADAVQAFTAALSLFPGDPQALQGLLQAQAALAGNVRSLPTYAQQMRHGREAYRRHRYADAVTAFTQALRLTPNDPQALANLAQANYALHMANGQAAMTARRYQDAVREFRAAVRQAPGDVLALNALRQASMLAH